MADVKPLKLDSGIIKQMGTGDTLPVANGGTGYTAFPVAAIHKTATETVTSSTTVQNDDALFLSVIANATYMFIINGWVNANAIGGWKAGFDYPAGATGSWNMMIGSTAYGGNSGLNSIVGATSALNQNLHITGYIVVSSTAGNLTLKWAQNASTINATTLSKGATMFLIRIS